MLYDGVWGCQITADGQVMGPSVASSHTQVTMFRARSQGDRHDVLVDSRHDLQYARWFLGTASS